jgi:hypothetical protein
LRGPLIERLDQIVRDPSAAPRDVLAAAGARMAASKINLANIATSINAQVHEELEQRRTRMEEALAGRGED